MSRDAPDVDPGVIPGSAAQDRMFAAVRAETPPGVASVISTPSGRRFRWRCPSCAASWSGPVTLAAGPGGNWTEEWIAAAGARLHNATHHGSEAATP